MKLIGKFEEIMVRFAPSIYRKYIRLENGKKVLYVRLKKALYSLLQEALLFYEKLSHNLVKNGFKINPYDPCIASKMLNRNQMIAMWHVDNLKVSHKDSKEVDKFIEFIRNKYENETRKVKVSRGKIHKYLE